MAVALIPRTQDVAGEEQRGQGKGQRERPVERAVGDLEEHGGLAEERRLARIHVAAPGEIARCDGAEGGHGAGDGGPQRRRQAFDEHLDGNGASRGDG
jgi:hypothetical protein